MRIFSALRKLGIESLKPKLNYEHISFCSKHFPASNKMVRVLNVAEKNDAAKSIAAIMSRGACRRRDGRSVYNKIYEFDYNLFNQQCKMVMTSVSGHLLNLEFTGAYKSWYVINFLCIPINVFYLGVFLKVKYVI